MIVTSMIMMLADFKIDVDGLDDVDVEAESQQTPDSADGLSQFLPCSNYLDWIENNSTHLQS